MVLPGTSFRIRRAFDSPAGQFVPRSARDGLNALVE
jgi:hypothetical protein